MAKEAKATKSTKDKAPKAEKKAAAPEHKYGVADLAKVMNIKDASVRVQLRNHNVKKAGKSYGWDTKDELQSVADSLKAPKKEAKGSAKKDKKAKEAA